MHTLHQALLSSPSLRASPTANYPHRRALGLKPPGPPKRWNIPCAQASAHTPWLLFDANTNNLGRECKGKEGAGLSRMPLCPGRAASGDHAEPVGGGTAGDTEIKARAADRDEERES